MTRYSVHQPWDPLKVCVVGKSYPPEFYSFIENSRLRNLFERIAHETEEDYQFLISTLKKFNVKIIRPNVPVNHNETLLTNRQRIPGPVSMIPRDQMIMVGSDFYVFPYDAIALKSSGRNVEISNWSEKNYNLLKGPDWPQEFTPYNQLPDWIHQECKNLLNFNYTPGENMNEFNTAHSMFPWWTPITNDVRNAGNNIIENQNHNILNKIPANGITRIGKDLYFGIDQNNLETIQQISEIYFQDYRCHFITTGGHIDGCFSPVVPGLIVSIVDMPTYAKTFPGWEVVYLKGESWSKVNSFLSLKEKNQGRWWIKGSEYDNELIDYVNTWLNDWVGYVEETVFDVNILTINEKNIIVNGYNKTAFDTFERYGITPHIVPLRHRYFWDGGIHCVTLDLDREGTQKDWFPERS